MKKTLVLIIMTFIICIAVVNSEEFTGYGDIKFGSSIEDVKKKFPDIKKDYSYNSGENEECWLSGEEPYYLTDKTILRAFKFVNGKLYEVIVCYFNYSLNESRSIHNQIAKKYNGIWVYTEKEDLPDTLSEAADLRFWNEETKKYQSDIELIFSSKSISYESKNLQNSFGATIGILRRYFYTDNILEYQIKEKEMEL